MTDSITGFYKTLHRPVTPALRISLSCSVGTMSNNCEVQKLVREFKERGLQNLLSSSPVQSYPTKVQRKAEVFSKPDEGRQEFALTWSDERHKASYQDSGESNHVSSGFDRTKADVCLMQLDMQVWGPLVVDGQVFGK